MTTKYTASGFTVQSAEMLELQHKLNDFMTLGNQYDVPSIVMVGMLDFAKGIVLASLLDAYTAENAKQKLKEEFMRSFDSVPRPLN